MARLAHRRVGLALGALGLVCAGLAGALLGYGSATAAGREEATGAAVVIVIAGKPTEFAFTLSRSSNLPWQAKTHSSTITFKVRNRGMIRHRFKVCSAPVKTAKLNTCNGTSTKLLQPGQATTLKVTFDKRGRYEYLSSVVGQAARGMKGLIGIGVPLPTTAAATTTGKTTTARPTTTPAPQPTTTTPAVTTPPATTPSSTPAPSGGDASAGAAVWTSAGCGNCHVLSEVKGNVSTNLSSWHPTAFDNGPLTTSQVADLIAYLDSTS